MKKSLVFMAIVLMGVPGAGQLRIDNASFIISPGTTVTVQGDITSNVSIQGSGLVLLKGSALQQLDMAGNTIPNLQLDNNSHVRLQNSHTRIGSSLVFSNGKFQTQHFDLVLSPAATITGAGNTRFVWTNGTGRLVKELSTDISNYELPVGENNNYRPAYLSANGSTYSSATVGVSVTADAAAAKPPTTASFLGTSWPVTRSGITGGTVQLSGQYLDATDINGIENDLRGYYYNGTDWSSVGETHNTAVNRVTALISSPSGVVTGMNKFILLGARAFLQGAYDPSSGLMRDDLRTLATFGTPANPANFPGSDPYAAAPYNAAFTHFNHPVSEVIPNSSVISSAPAVNDRIVDWVFIELRNTTAPPGNTLLATRSALIQRDGDIVDVDGVSPVTFNNLADGDYIICVRHRNHLGLGIDPSSARMINETRSAAFATNVIDMRTATDAQLYGTATAYTTASHPSLGTVKMLWGGNANMNTGIRYSAVGSDNTTILNQVLSFPGNTSQAYNYTGVIGYYSGDTNMNKNVRYVTSSDGAIILSNILSLGGAYNSTILNQQLPNF